MTGEWDVSGGRRLASLIVPSTYLVRAEMDWHRSECPGPLAVGIQARHTPGQRYSPNYGGVFIVAFGATTCGDMCIS
jgi:hypothetical protein